MAKKITSVIFLTLSFLVIGYQNAQAWNVRSACYFVASKVGLASKKMTQFHTNWVVKNQLIAGDNASIKDAISELTRIGTPEVEKYVQIFSSESDRALALAKVEVEFLRAERRIISSWVGPKFDHYRSFSTPHILEKAFNARNEHELSQKRMVVAETMPKETAVAIAEYITETGILHDRYWGDQNAFDRMNISYLDNAVDGLKMLRVFDLKNKTNLAAETGFKIYRMQPVGSSGREVKRLAEAAVLGGDGFSGTKDPHMLAGYFKGVSSLGRTTKFSNKISERDEIALIQRAIALDVSTETIVEIAKNFVSDPAYRTAETIIIQFANGNMNVPIGGIDTFNIESLNHMAQMSYLMESYLGDKEGFRSDLVHFSDSGRLIAQLKERAREAERRAMEARRFRDAEIRKRAEEALAKKRAAQQKAKSTVLVK